MRRGTIKSKTKHIQAKPVLKRAKPYVLVDLGDGHQSTPGEGPSRSDGLSSDKNRSLSAVEASSSDEETPVEQEQSSPKTADLDTLALSEAHSISLVEASPSKKETPFNQEESAPRPTDPEASNPSEAAGFPTVVHNAVLEGSIVARETESSNLYQNNQRQSEVFIYSRNYCIKITFSFPPKSKSIVVCMEVTQKKDKASSDWKPTIMYTVICRGI